MSTDDWNPISSAIGSVLGFATAPVLGPMGPILGSSLSHMLGQHGGAPQAPPPSGPDLTVDPEPGGTEVLPDRSLTPSPAELPAELPPPPAGPVPGSGAATDEANADAGRVAVAISDLHDLDKSAADTIDAIHAAGVAGQKQLDGISKDVDEKMTELGPRLDTPAGQQELRDFLKEKLTAAKKVLDEQIADAEAKARHTRELTQKYAGIGGGDPATQPASNSGSSGGGSGGGGTEGGSGGGEQGTAPAAAPAAAPGATPAGSQPTMPGAGMMPSGMGMPSMPSFGGGMPGLGGLGGGDPLGGLGGRGGGSGGFHDGDDHDDSDSHPGGKFHDDGSSGAGASSGKQGPDATGTTPASSGGAAGAGGGAGVEPAGHQDDHGGSPSPAATTSVSLPDGTDSDARTVQGADATRAALKGSTVADAWHQQGVTVPPPGTPVTEPIPPTQLKAGDIGIWQDHLVMAAGNGKVIVSGQTQPLSSVGSGPDFLGWMDPSAAAAKTVSATQPVPPTPPATPRLPGTPPPPRPS